MKVTIELSNGIVDGESKRYIEDFISSDVIEFTQRKSYDEYYYRVKQDWEVDIDILRRFIDIFGEVKFNRGTMRIRV
jgi:hypothetical protein